MIEQRKYWIQYRVIFPDGRMALGEQEVGCDVPISGTKNLQQISQVIAQQLAKEGKITVGATVQIVNFTRFEDEGIIRVQSLSAGGATEIPPRIQ